MEPLGSSGVGAVGAARPRRLASFRGGPKLSNGPSRGRPPGTQCRRASPPGRIRARHLQGSHPSGGLSGLPFASGRTPR
eukprot:11181496-Lingulodinium_polyedra.AAC.1